MTESRGGPDALDIVLATNYLAYLYIPYLYNPDVCEGVPPMDANQSLKLNPKMWQGENYTRPKTTPLLTYPPSLMFRPLKYHICLCLITPDISISPPLISSRRLNYVTQWNKGY